MKRSKYIILLLLIACVGLVLFKYAWPEPEKGTAGQPVSEKIKSVVVESAKTIFANGQVFIPSNSVPKVEYDTKGNITVEFMHVRARAKGERGGDNLGFMRFDPATLKPIEILGPGP